MKRGVEQSDGDRLAVHGLEDALEVRPLVVEKLLERRVAGGLVSQNHLADALDSLGEEEHVLRPRQPDAVGPVLPRLGGVGGRVGIGEHVDLPGGVDPRHELLQVARDGGRRDGQRALEHLAGEAVQGHAVALLESLGGAVGQLNLHGTTGLVNLERGAAADARPAPAAGDDRRVGGHAAARGQDALGGVHALDVVGAGLVTHQNARDSRLLQLHDLLVGEGQDANGGAGRRGEAGRERGLLVLVGVGVGEGGMQQLRWGVRGECRSAEPV